MFWTRYSQSFETLTTNNPFKDLVYLEANMPHKSQPHKIYELLFTNTSR